MARVILLRLTDGNGVNIAPGEATEKGYAGWIALDSVTFQDLSRSRASSITEVSIGKKLGKNSDTLFRMFQRTAGHLPCNGTLDLLDNDDVSRYTLTQVTIDRYTSVNGATLESITLECAPVKLPPQILKR